MWYRRQDRAEHLGGGPPGLCCLHFIGWLGCMGCMGCVAPSISSGPLLGLERGNRGPNQTVKIVSIGIGPKGEWAVQKDPALISPHPWMSCAGRGAGIGNGIGNGGCGDKTMAVKPSSETQHGHMSGPMITRCGASCGTGRHQKEGSNILAKATAAALPCLAKSLSPAWRLGPRACGCPFPFPRAFMPHARAAPCPQTW